jgi:hypothetical protein
MKGIQVLMLIALFAISACTKGYITEMIKKKYKDSIFVSLLDEIVLTNEDEKKIADAQEYLEKFDDDTENLTNDPRTEKIVEFKKASKQVVENILIDMEQLKNDYDSKIAKAKRLNTFVEDEITFERVVLGINEEYAKTAQYIVERAERWYYLVFLDAYNELIIHN